MRLENIRIAKGGLSDNIYAGYLNKDDMSWRKKIDVTDDFIKAVIDRWSGFTQTLTDSEGNKHRISVKKL